jgi:hypothetical protein
VSREHPFRPPAAKEKVDAEKEEEEEGVCRDSREVELLEGEDDAEKDRHRLRDKCCTIVNGNAKR